MAHRAGTGTRLSVKGIVILGLLGTLLFVAKLALAGLPNIELVSLLVMVYTTVFGRRALYPIYTYVALECLIFGIHFWTVSYLYVWAFLAFLSWLLRGMGNPLGWALLSGAFGLFFGAQCALVYLVTGGWAAALCWWVTGIPFDVLHCAGNFALALVLFVPCQRILIRLSAQMGL